jgi:subtilisin family serine protease
MNKIPTLFAALLLTCFSCSKRSHFEIIKTPNSISQRSAQIDSKNWNLQDIELDTVPGISLQRAYDSLLVNKKSKEVIVAVIDSEIDINHVGLKNHIWNNSKEVSDNQIDNDKNGYINGVNGWNFIGNIKKIAQKKYDDDISYFQAIKDNHIRVYDSYFNAKKRVQKLLEKGRLHC